MLVATVILALVNACTWLRDEPAACEGNGGFWGMEDDNTPAPVRVPAQSQPRE
jgi:hypothetical protein